MKCGETLEIKGRLIRLDHSALESIIFNRIQDDRASVKARLESEEKAEARGRLQYKVRRHPHYFDLRNASNSSRNARVNSGESVSAADRSIVRAMNHALLCSLW
jgi:hypothetical protein